MKRRFAGSLTCTLLIFGTGLFAPGTAVRAALPTELGGELEVIIKEDFEHGRFETDYFLRDDAGQDVYQLLFRRTPPGHLRSGQYVRVRGQPHGRQFQVDSLEEQGTASPLAGELADAQLPDQRRAVVLMVDLTNAKASTRYTLSQVAGHMYINSHSVDGLYREASLEQLRFPADTSGDGQPDVFGPFPIHYDNSTCDYYGWGTAAESAALAAGINLSAYRHRVFVLPRYSDLPACSWAGIANVGCGTYCRAWIAEAESGMVYAHELGHNLNMAHAGTDPGNDGTLDNVYGDSSDPMGSSRSWHVFNAGHIDQMGWYAGVPGAVTTLLTGGTYELAAIGNDPNASGVPEILKIAKPDTGDFYYLSYRQPIGYDGALSGTYTSGVNIHRYRGTGYGYTSHIKTLADGGMFSDGANGIHVSQLSHGSGYATVAVSFGCAPAAPTVALSPATLIVHPGVAANFSVAVTNQDTVSCGATTFSLGYSGPAGSVDPVTLSLAPGKSGAGSVAAESNLLDGNYALRVTATDLDGAAPAHPSAGLGGATLTIDGTEPTVPTGLTGSSDRQGRITLAWQSSTDLLSGVVGYTVYRNGAPLGQAAGTGYTDAATAAGTTYVYAVRAKDAAANFSPLSNAVSVTASGRKGGKK